MPSRSSISTLPDDVRQQLERKLIEGGFRDYQALSDWLADQGYQVSRSSVHRYGQQFEDRVQALKLATDQAKAIVNSAPDDEGAVSDALMRLVQEKLFGVLLNLGDIDPSKIHLGSLAKAIAELGRASVNQKKWMTEVRAKAHEAADKVTAIARKGGVPIELEQELRRQILGIVS